MSTYPIDNQDDYPLFLSETTGNNSAIDFWHITCFSVRVRTYKNSKLQCGMLNWTNSGTVFVIMRKGGRPKRFTKNVGQVITAPRGWHNAKPLIVRERIIEVYGSLSRIELFARNKARGWDAMGLDTDGRDIKEVLAA